MSGGSTGLSREAASNAASLSATFSTAQAGVVSGDASLDAVSDGTGVDGFGQLSWNDGRADFDHGLIILRVAGNRRSFRRRHVLGKRFEL